MLKTKETPMVVYHWWCDNPEIKPYQDMNNPVVPSIVTLRSHNKNIPISVLDLSCDPQDWGCFPELLNFQVVRWTPRLDLSLHKSSRLCSRVWDVSEYVNQIKNNEIIFTDSDIFWLKNPLPLTKSTEKFNCSSNTGVWYFNKNSAIAKEVFRTWKFIISRILIGDKEFFDEMCMKVYTAIDTPFQDEVAFGYLITQYPHLYSPVAFNENYMIYRLMNNDPLLESVKCLHGLGAVLGSKRGLICLVLKELRDSIKKVLSEEQVNVVFSGETCNDVYSIYDIHALSHKRLKEIMNFTGCLRADQLIAELKT